MGQEGFDGPGWGWGWLGLKRRSATRGVLGNGDRGLQRIPWVKTPGYHRASLCDGDGVRRVRAVLSCVGGM